MVTENNSELVLSSGYVNLGFEQPEPENLFLKIKYAREFYNHRTFLVI